VIIPLVTVIVASTLAGEQITLSFVAGGVLVLAGVLVGALLPSKPPSRPEPAPITPGETSISGEGAD
jgi:drug/metabolite transporter (DMT)-like permease